MRKKRTTLSDIAKIIRISPRAVSSALNNNGRISEEKRREVKAIARRLGYSPNIMARGLVKGKTYLIGVVFRNVFESFAPEILQGIEDQTLKAGYRTIVCSAGDNPQDQDDHIVDLLHRGVDGIITVPVCGWPETYFKIEDSGVPHVMLLHTTQCLSGPAVTVDNELGGYLATRHLIERTGVPPIHLPAPATNPEAEGRLAGFRRAIEEAGFKFDPDTMVYPKITIWWNHGRDAFHDLASQGRIPRGVFAVNDYVALGVLRAANELGKIRIPQDLAVVGFDDLLLSRWQAGIQLSTIRQPKQAIGELAVDMLFERMEGRVVKNHDFKPELVVRESS